MIIQANSLKIFLIADFKMIFSMRSNAHFYDEKVSEKHEKKKTLLDLSKNYP